MLRSAVWSLSFCNIMSMGYMCHQLLIQLNL